ncbi:MAG: hypothetical protein MJY53_04335 [Bacteroidales bacterium]|nr:hypothetical protein [Bacteroidales bacterium]
MLKRCICVAALVLPLLSCSVKDDRGDCPCHLRLSFDPEVEGNLVLTVNEAGRRVFYKENILSDSDGESLEYDFIRGNYAISVYGSTAQVTDDIMHIKPGQQSDSIYAWTSGKMNTNLENLEIRPELHKQFTTVYLSIASRSESDYKVIVSGGVNGMDMAFLRPLEGEFACLATRSDDWYYTVRLPRQLEDCSGSLYVGIYSGAELVYEYPLGAAIKEAGYDWNDEDLEDVYVSVDIDLVKVSVGVGDWENGGENSYNF